MGLPVIEDHERIRWITLDRPRTLNALELDDLPVIADAVRGVGAGIGAIVVTGAGDSAFSAGMHKATFLDATPESGREIITRIGDCLDAVRRCPLPTVAMVNGYCLGAAFEMVLACDLRVAHPDARFGLPEVKLGIPSVIDAALLPHYVGLSQAKEMILTGDMYSVRDLETFGLLNRVAPAGALRETVLDLVARLLPLTGEVLAAQKALFETWLNSGLQEGIDASIDVFAAMFEAPETTRAIARYQTGPRL